MKKKSKPTKKQVRHENVKRRRRQIQSDRRHSTLEAQDQLWHEMRPLLAQYNLRDGDQEEWYSFASQVMHDSAALYDQPEFQYIMLDPADAIHALLDEFNASVPSPEEFEKMSDEERDDIVGETYINIVTEFIQPEIQSDILAALVDCRARLKRKKKNDELALAAATEMLLRSDDRSEMWGTCGILHRILRQAVDEAFAFENAKAEALQVAQAIQPDVTDVYDLEDGSPADIAFWEKVDKTPGLNDYLDRQSELEDQVLEEEAFLDGELASELLDPEELREFIDDLVARLKAHDVDLEALPKPPQDGASQQALMEQLPEAIQAIFAPERFQELLDDLNEFIEQSDDSDPVAQRAEDLYDSLSDSDVTYWNNLAFIKFIFNALVASLVGAAQESFDDEAGGGDA